MPRPLPLVAPRLLRRMEAAAYLSVSPAYLDALRLRGSIRAVYLPSDRGPAGVSRTPLFDVRDLDNFIDSLKLGGADAAAATA